MSTPAATIDRRPLRLAIFGPGSAPAYDDGGGRFLRAVCHELTARGHSVALYGHLAQPVLELILEHVDVVLVHDSTAPELTATIRRHHAGGGAYRLLFYDSHRCAATAPLELRRFNLAGFDGVLAASRALRALYVRRGWTDRAWTWHEAADTDTFAPHAGVARTDDLVWIGRGHGIGCRQELGRMLLEPARRLGLSGVVHGDGFPWRARVAVQRSGLRHGGPLAEHLVPAVWARHRFTVVFPGSRHGLAGIAPERMFEALASGIPLICGAWGDVDGLFTPGRDFLLARDPREMETAMRTLREDRALAAELARQGRATVLARHTVAHRVDDLLAIVARLGGSSAPPRQAAEAVSGSAGFRAFSRKLREKPRASHYGSDREVGAR